MGKIAAVQRKSSRLTLPPAMEKKKIFLGLAVPGTLLTLILFSMTSIGHSLNVSLFIKPLFKARNAWAISTPASENLRVIVYDDSSAETLKKRPGINDWIKIANHLADLGYKKIIFPEVYELPDETTLETLNPSIEFIAGGAVHTKKFRSDPLPPTGLMDLPAEHIVNTLAIAGDILHAGNITKFNAKTGAVNLSSDYLAKSGFVTSNRKFIPHISLLAAPNLRISGTALTSDDGILPVDLAGSIYIEHLEPAAIVKMSVPVRSFFSKSEAGVRTLLPVNLKTALKGGTTALFVTDGNTGSAAFIDSQNGLVPTYFALASMVSNVMQQRLLIDCSNPEKFIFGAGLLLLLTAFLLPGVRCNVPAGSLLTLMIFTAILVFHFHAVVLPLVQITVLFLIAALANQAQHSVSLWRVELQKQKDLELGKEVQCLTLPAKMAGTMGSWEFEICYEPYGPMSGDWVQVYQNPDLNHEISGIIAIGDVVGKGPAAALNTASIAAIWSHFSCQWDNGVFDILNFLSSLNRNIHRTYAGSQMSSISVAVLMKDKVQLISCGSPTWLHITPESKVESVRAQPSNPLGLDRADFTVHVKDMHLDLGSMLLAHTDGVMDGGTARRNFTRNIKAAGLPENNVFSYLKREAVLAGAESVLPDDLTMLYLRRCA